MKIAKVVGVAVSTVKEVRLEGSKLLLVSETDQAGKVVGTPFIALDIVGVGPDELVIIVEGSTARVAAGGTDTPADATIIGVIDSLQFDGKTTFKKM